jgi:hypothetical protein
MESNCPCAYIQPFLLEYAQNPSVDTMVSREEHEKRFFKSFLVASFLCNTIILLTAGKDRSKHLAKTDNGHLTADYSNDLIEIFK